MTRMPPVYSILIDIRLAKGAKQQTQVPIITIAKPEIMIKEILLVQ